MIQNTLCELTKCRCCDDGGEVERAHTVYIGGGQ